MRSYDLTVEKTLKTCDFDKGQASSDVTESISVVEGVLKQVDAHSQTMPQNFWEVSSQRIKF